MFSLVLHDCSSWLHVVLLPHCTYKCDYCAYAHTEENLLISLTLFRLIPLLCDYFFCVMICLSIGRCFAFTLRQHHPSWHMVTQGLNWPFRLPSFRLYSINMLEPVSLFSIVLLDWFFKTKKQLKSAWNLHSNWNHLIQVPPLHEVKCKTLGPHLSTFIAIQDINMPCRLKWNPMRESPNGISYATQITLGGGTTQHLKSKLLKIEFRISSRLGKINTLQSKQPIFLPLERVPVFYLQTP